MSTKSATTPAGITSSSTGRLEALCTSEMSRLELCRSTSSHWAPTVCIQVPMLATKAASHTQRNTGRRSGAHIPPGAAGGLASVGAVTSPPLGPPGPTAG